MSMALQSVLFLSCLISLHIKHLEDPYIKIIVRESHITDTLHLHTHKHTSKHLSRYNWVKGPVKILFLYTTKRFTKLAR